MYRLIENLFEKISALAGRLFSNSLVFIAAVGLVVSWFSVYQWNSAKAADVIRDLILATTFLSFFIIQKTFSHFSHVIHLKLNELVSADKNAHNHIIKAEDKTMEEIVEMAKEHSDLSAGKEKSVK